MKLTFRPATSADGAALVGLYDRHYQGGYSASFDRYGPAAPQDIWWVQSEKSVTVIEANRRPAGMVLLGTSGRRLLAEEVLFDPAAGSEPAAMDQVHTFLTRAFQQSRQDRLTVRCAESNAFALAMAARHAFAFAGMLLVATGGAVEGALPAGYAIRRAVAEDARTIERLHEETLGGSPWTQERDALWRGADVRVLLAERDHFPVGFAAVQVRDGMGRWSIGVREHHRRKGIGRALAHQALRFIQARRVPAVATYWGTDPAAAQFVRALGARTERTYLYLERRL